MCVCIYIYIYIYIEVNKEIKSDCYESFFFLYTHFSPAISSNIHHYFNNIFHEFKVLKKVITTKTFNVNFHNSSNFEIFCFSIFLHIYSGVMDTVVGNGHHEPSSNPGWDWLHFHKAPILLRKVWIQLFSIQLWLISRADLVLKVWYGNLSRRRKTLNLSLLNFVKEKWTYPGKTCLCVPSMQKQKWPL